MTREEAIEILKTSTMKDTLSDQWQEAYKMAIQALSQEPCDDAISRQYIIDTYKSCADMLSDEELKGADLVMEWVNNAQPVTQKSGKWILQPSNKEQGERDFIWWKCSECGHVIYSETEKDRREYHAFCGRCGARMDEPQGGEEV